MTEMKITEKRQITNQCKPYRHQKNYEKNTANNFTG